MQPSSSYGHPCACSHTRAMRGMSASIQSARFRTWAATLAHGRQAVFHMGRHHGESDALDQPVLFKPLQGLGEHPLADPVDRAPEFAEAVGPLHQCDEDQHAPAAGHMLEDLA